MDVRDREGHAVAPVLSVRDLSCGYGQRTVLSDVSFELREGGMLVLLGPNGVGKTTLFKTILGFLPHRAGEVRIDGRDASGWTRRQFARAVAYVPQRHEATFGFLVRDMVLMGRTPSLGGLSTPKRADERIAEAALEALGIEHLAERDCTTLSGGEMQMVLVARAIAQQPRLLVMDEPCASLDLGNQVVLLRRIAALAASGLATIITSHDPNHAFLLDCDVVCIGRDGAIASGAARDVLTQQRLSRLYGATVQVGPIGGDAGQMACAAVLADGGMESVDRP